MPEKSSTLDKFKVLAAPTTIASTGFNRIQGFWAQHTQKVPPKTASNYKPPPTSTVNISGSHPKERISKNGVDGPTASYTSERRVRGRSRSLDSADFLTSEHLPGAVTSTGTAAANARRNPQPTRSKREL